MEEKTNKETAVEMIMVEKSQIEKKDDETIINLDKTINFDTLEPNSVIVLKIGGDGGHKIRLHQAFVRYVQSKGSLFKDRHFTVLFLEPEDSLNVLTEKDMESAGWVKKEKSLIVKPH